MIVGREPFLGIAFVKETPSLRFGRVAILHTSDGPFTATKNTRSRVSVMVTRWRRWLRCGVPCGKRMHPPHQQSCHRTKKSTSTFVFKSSSVSPKHPWRPRPTPRGRRCLVSTTEPNAQTPRSGPSPVSKGADGKKPEPRVSQKPAPKWEASTYKGNVNGMA